jgi:uncharacterized protein (DUF885 family)
MTFMTYKSIRTYFSVTILLCLSIVKVNAQQPAQNRQLQQLFDNYYEDRLKLFPLEATSIGDNRYNDLLPNDGSAEYLGLVHNFYTKYQDELKSYKPESLNLQDKISYYILEEILNRELEAEKYHKEWMPFAQFFSLPNKMGQLGNGKGDQPFKTVKDYQNWLSRVDVFAGVWTDTTIANFRKGIKAGIVLPKALVVKMVPQFESLAQTDTAKNVFYGPVKNFPAQFSEAEKKMLKEKYDAAITGKLAPAYKKLADFFKGEYMTAARSTSGLNALPNGDAMYRYYTWFFTTTHKTPEEFYQTGLSEVRRITAEMEKLKDRMGYKGTLKELFAFMQNDKQFYPFKTEQQVLDTNKAVLGKITPHLKELFNVTPKTPFEVRAVESFRAAAAAPQYNASSADGTRPGIYYIPILDPTKINTTNWPLEATFLHEAIPGHHYQLSLMREDMTLPKFRRFGGFSAFSEGWALYCESLGEQLGCYTDPSQRMGAYGTEIHRAIRLVTDVGLHTGKMTREEAIKYMMENESISEQIATQEIERYMAFPGQALSYKTGELKIKELRDKYRKQLGAKFNLRDFHDALLKGGSMPLSVFEMYMDEWAKSR